MRKKIAFLIPTLIAGGMERVMSELLNYYASNTEHELHLVLYGKKHEQFYDILDSIFVHKPDLKYRESKRLLYTVKTMIYLRKEVKRINPDTILSFGEIWNNFVLLALRGFNYPIFISDRCCPNKSFGWLHDHLRKWLYPMATGIIAQTEMAKEIYSTQFTHSNICVIGNPIRQVEVKTVEKENIVLSIGRLISSKNYDQLIRIFSKIAYADWRLIIIGGDAIKQKNSIKLQRMIDDMKLGDRIILAGPQKDIASYLLKSKIFAFTSSSEGFPNVIGEALSAGLPVIAYDCIAGPKDMIENEKNGYLIPLFNEQMFGDKMKKLMEREEMQIKMSEYASKSIGKFSTKEICEKYLDFILKV